MGRWLIPADAPPGQDPARVVVLGYQFWQRYYAGDPGVVGRTLQLVRKDYQIVGVMPPRFRWREADIYLPAQGQVRAQHFLRRHAQDPAGRIDRGSRRRIATDPAGVREAVTGALPGYVSRAPAQHHRVVRQADGAQTLSAARRGDVAAARGVRQRLDSVARARGPPPAGACRARGARSRTRTHRAAVIDRGGRHCGGRSGAGSIDRVEGPGPDRRLGAYQLIRRRVGHRDERAGSGVQHRAGCRDRDRLRRLARSPALAPGPRPRGADQRAPRDRQRARPARPSRDDRSASGVDAPDADRGWRGGEGVPETGQRGPRVRPSEHHVPADPRPRRYVPDLEGAFGILRAAPRQQSPPCRRSCRRGFRPTPPRRRTEATARSRSSAAVRSRSPSPGPTSSVPSIFRCSTFRSRRDASGVATKRREVPALP